MEQQLYNVIFMGPTQDDADHTDKLSQGLMDYFGLSIESVTKMMRWAPITVKKQVTFEEAADYRVVLESLGAHVKLESTDGAVEDKPVSQPETHKEASKRKSISKKTFVFMIATAIIMAIVITLWLVNIPIF